jgi:hypothetical protein
MGEHLSSLGRVLAAAGRWPAAAHPGAPATAIDGVTPSPGPPPDLLAMHVLIQERPLI